MRQTCDTTPRLAVDMVERRIGGWLNVVLVGSLYDWLFHILVSQMASGLFIECRVGVTMLYPQSEGMS